MNEPLWDGHPHFAQFGVDRLFAAMLDRCADAIDVIEVSLPKPGSATFHASREPDLTPPAECPANTVWLPDIRRRRPLVTMDEADPRREMRDAMASLIGAMPYRMDGDDWPYGVPSLEFRRCGASLKMPYASGTVAIYAEGRKKELAPEMPFWMSLVTVYHDRRRPPASDILSAGGMAEYVLRSLIDDERVLTPPDVRPLASRPINTHLMSIDLPLDTYARPMKDTP